MFYFDLFFRFVLTLVSVTLTTAGELFSVLSKHSILRYSLDGEGFGDQEEDEAAFLDGVRRGCVLFLFLLFFPPMLFCFTLQSSLAFDVLGTCLCDAHSLVCGASSFLNVESISTSFLFLLNLGAQSRSSIWWGGAHFIIFGCRHASPEEVTHAMFTVRSRSLLYPEEATAAKLWAYLSGLLIGVELAGAKVVPKSTVYLIGQESLAARSLSFLCPVGGVFRAHARFLCFLSVRVAGVAFLFPSRRHSCLGG